MVEIKTYPDTVRLMRAAAEHFVTLAAKCIDTHGRFAVALSGGSTPKTMYELLATPDFSERVDWSHVHIFWGDERCVPIDHIESNYRMACETLLEHIPIPSSNIHRIHSEMEPERAAAEYNLTLHTFFAQYPECKANNCDEPTARFDLILLGMGDDGHTASLFPSTKVIHQQKRWVIAHYVEKLNAWRVTLTPVVINAAADVTFIVSGKEKAEKLRQVLNGPYQPEVLPAQIVRPPAGHLLWLVDAEAAALL